jgi:hypothetical protein
MNGTFILTRKDTKQVVASINAPYKTDPETIKLHWVASQGMSAEIAKDVSVDYCPVTDWKDSLEHVLTPVDQIPPREPKKTTVELCEVILDGNDSPHDDNGTQNVEVYLENPDALVVQFEGHGCAGYVEGGGQVLFELYKGVPRVVIWADIRQEDPTNIIYLDQAHEKHRPIDVDADTEIH